MLTGYLPRVIYHKYVNIRRQIDPFVVRCVERATPDPVNTSGVPIRNCHPLGPCSSPSQSLTVVLGRGAVSYERGTPVDHTEEEDDEEGLNTDRWSHAPPPSEFGTHKIVKARLWHWLEPFSGNSLEYLSTCSLLVWQRIGEDLQGYLTSKNCSPLRPYRRTMPMVLRGS